MPKILDIKKRIMQKRKNDRLNAPIEIRDAREREYFIVDDAYLNGFARICGPLASMVYLVLCRHAGKDQTCYPSVILMMEKLKMSAHSIIKGLHVLEAHKIIKIDRKKGQPNIYTLLNKRHWKKTPVLIPDVIDAMTYVGDQQEPFAVRKKKNLTMKMR